MKIGIPKESLVGENRVAATPESVKQMLKLGFTVMVESGAGKLANFSDDAYIAAGAEVSNDTALVWASDIVMKVNAPRQDHNVHEIDLLKEKSTVVSFISPGQNATLIEELSRKNINVLAMDAVPRISRAQSLDALSSMANIAGYRAIVEAAHHFGRFFTGQITAAGKVPPAKVLIIGAGVAGLAAIGAASSLGAIVRAFDTRPEVKEQINSMGGEFLEIDFQEDASAGDGYAKVMSDAFIKAEMALFAQQAKEVDIIVTTALIPGKPAPKLITREMVQSMKSGSVIVDLAAANGGNCEYSEAGKVIVTDNDVTVIGYTDLPSRLPTQSSQMYATNLINLLKLLCPEKNGLLTIDFEDEVLRGMTVIKAGQICWPPPPIKVSAPAPQQATAVLETAEPEKKTLSTKVKAGLFAAGAVSIGYIANSAPTEFLSHFTVFVLACIIGYYVVWNVSHSLHTPLMSVTNAISGIIVVGALLQVGQGNWFVTLLACIAVLVASINIFGGFLVTNRMLKMFSKGE